MVTGLFKVFHVKMRYVAHFKYSSASVTRLYIILSSFFQGTEVVYAYLTHVQEFVVK
jgi:hypothetical protein